MEANLLESSPVSSRFDDCREAIVEFLATESEEARSHIRRLVREMTVQHVSIGKALECYRQCAQSTLDEAPPYERARVFSAMGLLHSDLGDEFDQWINQELRSHARLTSAYCQKDREVKTLLDNLPAFAFLKDAEFRYSAVNPRWFPTS